MIWITLLLTFITTTFSFTVQGNWALVPTPSLRLTGPPITLNISDFVFMNQSILQKLAFSGCELMLLQSQFSQNQLFINSNSYFTQPIAGQDCSTLQTNPLDMIYQGLYSVFYFQILIDQLNFNDPYGRTIFSFKRIVNSVSPNITGIWNMNQFASTRTALSVQISPTQITLCQGNAVYNYSFPKQRNTIKLIPVSNTCPSTDLINAIQSTLYYRISNGILDLYDANVTLSAEMIYSNPYDPAKPLFSSTPVVATPVTPPPVISVPPAPTFSASNISGNWSIVSLFGISFPSTTYYLTISATNIVLNGGCNTYSFPYTINPVPQTITLGNAIATLIYCANSDDQLYVSGISKMFKYLTSVTSTAYSLIFYDQAGKPTYSLYQKISTPAPTAPQINTNTVTPPTKVSNSPSSPFVSGTYLLLLLQRRDLPRAIVNLTPTTFTYSLCNTISHTYSLAQPNSPKGSITISGAAQTKKACPQSTDDIYISALNSAVSYTSDPNTSTITFLNKSGVQVVVFTAAS